MEFYLLQNFGETCNSSTINKFKQQYGPEPED